MSFDDLPPQAPINVNADAYAAECVKRSRDAAASTRCRLDVPYGASYWQKLDLYLPKDAAARNLPVLLFMHGGGWTHGYKEWCGFMAPVLVDLPAIFVSVSYRLIPDVAYPAPLWDCIHALKWVHDNAADFGASPERLFVGGHSAGGQIAALMALQPELLAAAGVPADVIKGVFCVSTTFNRRMVNPSAAPDHVPKEPFTAIAPDSPIALADRARAPFLITWGGKEGEHLERTGRQMIAALDRAKCRVESHVFPDDDHFSIHLNTAREDDWWTRRVRAMMSASG